MMTRVIKANLYFFFMDIKGSIFIFWSIFLSSVAALLAITSLFQTDVVIIVSPIVVMCIYCFVVGFFFTKRNLSYCIKLGTTRTSFHLSVSIFLLAFVIGMALFSQGVTFAIEWVTSAILNLDKFQLLSPTEALLTESDFLLTTIADSILMFFFLCFAYLIGTIVYRFGQIGGYIPFAVLIVLLLMPFSQKFLYTFVGKFPTHFLQNILIIFFTGALLQFITWLFLLRASSKPATTR